MRHAQEYWLRIQANAAIRLANETPEPPNAFSADDIVGGIDALLHYRERCLRNAANALLSAEKIHREIVRRGGRP